MNKNLESRQSVRLQGPILKVGGALLAASVAAGCGGAANAPRYEAGTAPAAPSTEASAATQPASASSDKQVSADLCASIPSSVFYAVLESASAEGESPGVECSQSNGDEPPGTLFFSPADIAHFRVGEAGAAEATVTIGPADIGGINQLKLYAEGEGKEALTVENYPAVFAPVVGILCLEAYKNFMCVNVGGSGAEAGQRQEQLDIQLAQAVLKYGYS